MCRHRTGLQDKGHRDRRISATSCVQRGQPTGNLRDLLQADDDDDGVDDDDDDGNSADIDSI